MEITIKRRRGITRKLIAVCIVLEVVAVINVFANGSQVLTINKPTEVIAGPFERICMPIGGIAYVGTFTRNLV